MSYFDQRARGYLESGNRGVWRLFRQAESKLVLRALALKPGDDVLDVGCGAGFYALRMKSLGARVVGIDTSAEMIREYRGFGFDGCVGDFLSFESAARFDKILVAGSGEFMSGTRSILAQINRNLRPGGTAVVLAPRANWLGRLYRHWHRSHGYRVYFHDYKNAANDLPELDWLGEHDATPISRVHVLSRRLGS